MKAIKRIFNHQNRASATGEKKMKRCRYPSCGREFTPRDQFDQLCPRCLMTFSQPTPSRRRFPEAQPTPRDFVYAHQDYSERRTRNVSGPSPPQRPTYPQPRPPPPVPQRSASRYREREEPYYGAVRFSPTPDALNSGSVVAGNTLAQPGRTWLGRRSSAGHTPGLALRELRPVEPADNHHDMPPPTQHYHIHNEPRAQTVHQQGLYTAGANRSALQLDTGTSRSRGIETPQCAVEYVYGGADHTGFPICIPVPVSRPQPSTQVPAFNATPSNPYATSYAAAAPTRPPFAPYVSTTSRPSGTSRRGPRPRSNSFGGWQWPTS
ncbi:hypothetical protein C8Q78DRAFT_322173 [Trametes maxima]|nr:hypothetical protein C8Q78DRAFT_322173 [Trametes maxima]